MGYQPTDTPPPQSPPQGGSVIMSQARAAIDALAQAVAASGITIGTKPQYEEMLHSPPDWRPQQYYATFPECGDE